MRQNEQGSCHAIIAGLSGGFTCGGYNEINVAPVVYSPEAQPALATCMTGEVSYLDGLSIVYPEFSLRDEGMVSHSRGLSLVHGIHC